VAGPILVFGPTPPEAAENLVAYDLIQSVTGLAPAQALDAVAHRCGSKIPVHLKVDSGMGRLGLLPDNPGGGALTAAAEAAAIARLPGLRLEGVYTHFAAADEADKTYAHHQFRVFTAFLDTLQAAGIDPGLRHAANSAAIIDLPDTHLNLVRAGIALYGLAPSAEVDTTTVRLRPAMALKARVVHVKKVPAGFPVSYGSTYRTAAPTTIATVPVGYADGYSRNLSNRGRMLVRGKSAPIAGRVCMDQTMGFRWATRW
jgi:alanine racemase